jgi:hypothetical protein
MRRISLDLCAGRLVKDTRKKRGLRLRLNRNREPPTHKRKSQRIKSALAIAAQPSATPQPRTATANRLHIRGNRSALNPRLPCRQTFLALAPGSDQNGKNRKTGKNADKKRATMPANAF